MTIIVPNAMERATIALGIFHFGGSKPMLFQASAEKSEPTCATPNAIKRPKKPLAAVTVRNQAAQEIGAGFDRLRVAHRPKVRKIIGDGRVISSTNIPRTISPTKESVFADVKMF